MGQLVLSRKVGEKLFIGSNIVITLVRLGPNTARIGIDCPREINIAREKLTDDESRKSRPQTDHTES